VGRAVFRVATNSGGNAIPVQFARQANVAEHDVRAEALGFRQGPLTVRDDLDLVAGDLQQAAETLAKSPIVFDDQDPMICRQGGLSHAMTLREPYVPVNRP